MLFSFPIPSFLGPAQRWHVPELFDGVLLLWGCAWPELPHIAALTIAQPRRQPQLQGEAGL